MELGQEKLKVYLREMRLLLSCERSRVSYLADSGKHLPSERTTWVFWSFIFVECSQQCVIATRKPEDASAVGKGRKHDTDDV